LCTGFIHAGMLCRWFSFEQHVQGLSTRMAYRTIAIEFLGTDLVR
jgi:hypothetical protein